MVLVSVQSVESNNGYQFSNQFSESLIIDPNSRISLINIQFERRVDYVVLQGGNAFEIKVGDPTVAREVIGIPAGTYDANSLAQEIQSSLNQHYHSSGYNFSVVYDDKDKKFSITNSYIPLTLVPSLNKSWDTTTLNKVETALTIRNHNGFVHFGPIPKARGHGPWTGITLGTSNYVLGASQLETEYVPTLNEGGSFGEFQMNWTGAGYPLLPTAPSTSKGIVLGFTQEFTAGVPAVGVKQVADNANLLWVASGLVFHADATGAIKVKVIEGGQDIGIDIDFVPRKNDMYKITLSSDNVYPTYQYKRVGGSYTNFNINGGNQVLSQTSWKNLELHPFIACDNPDAGNGPTITCSTTNKGSSNVQPTALVGVGANYTYTDNSASKTSDTLDRTTAGLLATGYNVDGFLSQNLVADTYSEFQFSMPSTGGDFYVSVIEEEKRVEVATAVGGASNGIVDSAWGNTVQNDGYYSVQPATNFNSALSVYRFQGWDGDTTATQYPSGKVYKRRDFNAYNEKGTGPILAPYEDITGSFDWSTSANALFIVRVEGNSNKVQLWVSVLGDKSDLVLLDEHAVPVIEYDGIKTLGTIIDGSDYGGVDFTPDQTQALFRYGNANTSANFRADTDADGKITGTINVVNAGYGYVETTEYGIEEITDAGVRVGTGEAKSPLQANVDNEFNSAMGTAFKDTKVNNGYRFFMGFGNAEIVNATATVSQVSNVKLLTSQAINDNDYFELYPQVEPDFGKMIGYSKDKYVVPSKSTVSSDTSLIPNQQLATNPTLMINVDNLPHKSYIGKAFKKDSILGSKPVGNSQGLTKMVGKVPRHHDDGDGGKSNKGPFYFDYFPYTIPLRNATEITLNELDITIRNPDGTLATDVIESHILLDISNVEGAGEAVNQGVIGKPLSAPMNYDRLNVPKGQLEPSLRGGFGQSDAGMTPNNNLDATPMDHL